MSARRHDFGEQDGVHHFAFVVGFEQAAHGERFPQHDRCRIHVRLPRQGLTSELLGRHVRDLAFHLPFARRLHATGGLGDPEVEHARDAVEPDQDVLR